MGHPERVAAPVSLYTVRKRCHECGTEWDGPSFVPQPTGVPSLPGICVPCADADEARMRLLTAKDHARVTQLVLPELRRPVRPPDADD